MILQIYIIHLKKQVFCKLFINTPNHSGGRYKKSSPALAHRTAFINYEMPNPDKTNCTLLHPNKRSRAVAYITKLEISKLHARLGLEPTPAT